MKGAPLMQQIDKGNICRLHKALGLSHVLWIHVLSEGVDVRGTIHGVHSTLHVVTVLYISQNSTSS